MVVGDCEVISIVALLDVVGPTDAVVSVVLSAAAVVEEVVESVAVSVVDCVAVPGTLGLPVDTTAGVVSVDASLVLKETCVDTVEVGSPEPSVEVLVLADAVGVPEDTLDRVVISADVVVSCDVKSVVSDAAVVMVAELPLMETETVDADCVLVSVAVVSVAAVLMEDEAAVLAVPTVVVIAL